MTNETKITKEQLLKEYNRGWTDGKISEKYNMSRREVTYRRWKLGLQPNNPHRGCKVLNVDEQKIRILQHSIRSGNRRIAKFKKELSELLK